VLSEASLRILFNHKWIRLAGGALCTLAIVCVPSSVAHAQDDAARIFATTCAECHGSDGSGHAPKGEIAHIPDMHSATVQKQSDADLAEMIVNGKRSSRGLNYSMPSNKGKLSDQQVKQLVAYIRAIAKK
jgi:mono/diheme cytochrome c family protein